LPISGFYRGPRDQLAALVYTPPSKPMLRIANSLLQLFSAPLYLSHPFGISNSFSTLHLTFWNTLFLSWLCSKKLSLYFINIKLFVSFQIYYILHATFLLPSCSDSLYFSNWSPLFYICDNQHNSVQKTIVCLLSPHPSYTPITNHPVPFLTHTYIQTNLLPVCLPLPTLYLTKLLPNTHHQSLLVIYILSPFHYVLNMHLSYPLHTPISPLIAHSHNSFFALILSQTIHYFIPLPIPLIKIPLHHFLHIYSSPHNTPSYKTYAHHSFPITKFSTLPFLFHTSHPITTKHCPYISSKQQYSSGQLIQIYNYLLSSTPSILLCYKLFITFQYILYMNPNPKYLLSWLLLLNITNPFFTSLDNNRPINHHYANQHTPAILTLQETKLTSKISPKFIFPIQTSV
jgi:hypothetical protein